MAAHGVAEKTCHVMACDLSHAMAGAPPPPPRVPRALQGREGRPARLAPTPQSQDSRNQSGADGLTSRKRMSTKEKKAMQIRDFIASSESAVATDRRLPIDADAK